MSTDRNSTDQIGSMETLQPSDTDQKPTNSDASKDQSIPSKDEKVIGPPSVSLNSTGANRPVQIQVTTPVGSGADRSFPYTPNLYSPQAQAFYYGGYESASGDWEEYPPHYVNLDGLEVGPAMVYNEDQPVMYHAYGYNPQIPYGPYSPAASPLPTVTSDGQFYSPQHFPFSGSGPYYQQQPSPYPPTPNHVISQMDPNSIGPMDATGQGSFLPSDMLFGRDWSKQPDGSSMAMLPSPVASPQPIPMHNSFGQTSVPGMVTQTHQKPYYGFGFSNNSYDRGYQPSIPYHNFGNYTNYSGPVANSTTNNNRGSGFFSMDKNRRRSGPGGPKGNALICSCNGSSLDFLTEQNRGPRATRPKKQEAELDEKISSNNNKENVVGILKGPNGETYNGPEFPTDYKDAKFFIIKSYSEDNVHKSIKYSVWASTVNGNKKLDGAYHEAKEKEEPCPVFLFFSVNASSQFCGVAEMVGAVDFEKSVNYWQQDKWTGQFPVKWHFVKDVPNNLFRHIILENNDNKPVTNSRDTQEVKLEQGIEMLTIFKNHEADTHLLEDFEYYEKREKLMQENRAHQLQHHLPPQQIQQPQLQIQKPGSIIDPSGIKPVSVSDGNLVGQLSKTFARAVRVEENKSAALGMPKDKSSSVLSKAEDLAESK